MRFLSSGWWKILNKYVLFIDPICAVFDLIDLEFIII